MISRRYLSIVQERLEQFPAVALLGPRQAGKTTLAEMVAEGRPSLYLDLESPADRDRLAEPELYLSVHQDKLVVIDEVQRFPALFEVLRGLIDRGRRQGRKGGQFLLLGSAFLVLILRRFLTMLAHGQSTLLNAAQLARGLAVDGKTVARYLDLLVVVYAGEERYPLTEGVEAISLAALAGILAGLK